MGRQRNRPQMKEQFFRRTRWNGGNQFTRESLPLWKAVRRYLKKLKMDLHFDPAIPLLGIYLKEPQITNSKEHKHPYIHCSVIYNHQDMEGAQVSLNRWMDKIIVGYLHNGILLSYKKEDNLWKHILCYWIGRIHIIKMAILHKTICTFNAIPIKIPMTYFTDTEQTFQKFEWNHKQPQIASAILGKKNK